MPFQFALLEGNFRGAWFSMIFHTFLLRVAECLIAATNSCSSTVSLCSDFFWWLFLPAQPKKSKILLSFQTAFGFSDVGKSSACWVWCEILFRHAFLGLLWRSEGGSASTWDAHRVFWHVIVYFGTCFPLLLATSHFYLAQFHPGLDSPREDGRHHVVVQFCLVHFQ